MRFVRQAAAVSAAGHAHQSAPKDGTPDVDSGPPSGLHQTSDASHKPARVPFLAEESWPDYFLLEAAKAEQQIRLRELMAGNRASNMEKAG